jgi:pimeloyl-ACP methyl ester carboxylesterase
LQWSGAIVRRILWRGAVTNTRNHVDDLRGASRLAIEATQGITALVEEMHRTIAGGPDVLGRPLAGPAAKMLAPIYGGIRAVTKLIGHGIDGALGQLSGLLGERVPMAEHEALVAVLNGVLGDYLQETGNPLAITMRLRQGGQPLAAALPDASRKLLVLVHGSCMNDLQWNRRGHDHGAALAQELGYTAVYLHYNSGLHVSTNGEAFAALLEQLVTERPVDEIVIVAHSMGGLVSRSACWFGEVAGHAWRGKLTKLVCLGTPHHGAPLERGGNWIDVLLEVSRYSAPLARLGRIRSAGVTDLRFGNVRHEDWEGRDRFAAGADVRVLLPLPTGVACHAIAGVVRAEASGKAETDGLVPVGSALGRGETPERELGFAESARWIAYETAHLDLLDSPQVYAKLVEWLR